MRLWVCVCILDFAMRLSMVFCLRNCLWSIRNMHNKLTGWKEKRPSVCVCVHMWLWPTLYHIRKLYKELFISISLSASLYVNSEHINCSSTWQRIYAMPPNSFWVYVCIFSLPQLSLSLPLPHPISNTLGVYFCSYYMNVLHYIVCLYHSATANICQTCSVRRYRTRTLHTIQMEPNVNWTGI